MLSPFTREDLDEIKPASLQIAFEGRVVYWDEKRKKVDKLISATKGKNTERQFTLKRNSIAFVQVKPRFQLPYYIAIRFNLKITHVYRGLLLGTGPIRGILGYEGTCIPRYIILPITTMNSWEVKDCYGWNLRSCNGMTTIAISIRAILPTGTPSTRRASQLFRVAKSI